MGEIWRVAGGFAVPLGVGVPFAARKRAFGVFIGRAVAIFVRLSRFICRAFGVFLCKCRWLAPLGGYLVITTLITTIVTIQAQ